MLKAVQSLFASTPTLKSNEIDGVLVSTNENSKYLAAEISESLGIRPKHAHTVENLCSSGSNAIVSAYAYIRAGLADMIMVIGADESNGPGQVLDADISRGRFSHPIYWASLFTASYKRRYGINAEHIATVSAKNHMHAKDNPLALYSKEYSVTDILESKEITSDIHLYECSRICTGASAVLLASQNMIKRLECKNPAWITGVGGETDSASVSHIWDFSSLHSASVAAHDAMNMAKISPDDIDVAEVHDAFAICEPMALEAVKMADRGRGVELSNELYTTRNKMINPRGGLIGSGHPIGATGVAQMAEITAQVTGSAGLRQVQGARIGLVQNMSAAATSSTVLVLNCEL
ncbi:MAG: Thiolase [Cenarchaeum symbiont of Oopsacas minuta]|nr:Thiolase [Cenarchaeum symbiont of Oopsacas minuta]